MNIIKMLFAAQRLPPHCSQPVVLALLRAPSGACRQETPKVPSAIVENRARASSSPIASAICACNCANSSRFCAARLVPCAIRCERTATWSPSGGGECLRIHHTTEVFECCIISRGDRSCHRHHRFVAFSFVRSATAGTVSCPVVGPLHCSAGSLLRRPGACRLPGPMSPKGPVFLLFWCPSRFASLRPPAAAGGDYVASPALSVACLSARVLSVERPNILLFLTDDQDLVLGGGRAGGPMAQVRAPCAARRRRSGRSTRPSVPSRAELQTGRYYHNIANSATRTPAPDVTSGAVGHVDLGAKVWPNLFTGALRAAGYRTGLFGKCMNEDCGANAYAGGANLHLMATGFDRWFEHAGYENGTFFDYDAFNLSATPPRGCDPALGSPPVAAAAQAAACHATLRRAGDPLVAGRGDGAKCARRRRRQRASLRLGVARLAGTTRRRSATPRSSGCARSTWPTTPRRGSCTRAARSARPRRRRPGTRARAPRREPAAAQLQLLGQSEAAGRVRAPPADGPGERDGRPRRRVVGAAPSSRRSRAASRARSRMRTRPRPTLSAADRCRALLAVDDSYAGILGALDAPGERDDTPCARDVGPRVQPRPPHAAVEQVCAVRTRAARADDVFAGPGIAEGRELAFPGTQVDLAPTILAFAGLDAPAEMDGRSVAPCSCATRRRRPRGCRGDAQPPARARRARAREASFHEYYNQGPRTAVDGAAEPWVLDDWSNTYIGAGRTPAPSARGSTPSSTPTASRVGPATKRTCTRVLQPHRRPDELRPCTTRRRRARRNQRRARQPRAPCATLWVLDGDATSARTWPTT